jgi:hypothetical protein
MALGSTQPLTELVPGIFPGGKGGRCIVLTLPPSCADCLKSGNLNLLETAGRVKACNGIALPSTNYNSVRYLKISGGGGGDEPFTAPSSPL